MLMSERLVMRMIGSALGVLLCAGAALGQQAPVAGPSAAADERLFPRGALGPPGATLSFRAGQVYAFSTDVDGSRADVSGSRTNLSMNFGAELNESWRVDAVIDGELSFFDWGDAGDILPPMREPFEELYGTGALVRVTWGIEDPWFITVAGQVRSGWEGGADAADGVTAGGFAAVGYRFSDKLTFTLGGGATTRLDDNAAIFPFIGFRWQIAEKLRLVSRGLGLDLTYSPSDEFDVTFGGGLERREYRLADGRASLPDGVLRSDRVPIGVEFSWKPISGLRLSLSGGALVYQNFEFLNSNGNEIREIETDPTPYVGVSLEYSF